MTAQNWARDYHDDDKNNNIGKVYSFEYTDATSRRSLLRNNVFQCPVIVALMWSEIIV
jgi:hypothetical protein